VDEEDGFVDLVCVCARESLTGATDRAATSATVRMRMMFLANIVEFYTRVARALQRSPGKGDLRA
jgi:hypothetical protein